MINLFGIHLGSKFPSTISFENNLAELSKNHKRYIDFQNSSLLQEFTELDELVHSGDFEKRVERLKNEKFESTDAYRKYKNYLTLKKSSDIRGYISFIQKGTEKRLDETLISAQYLEFKELEMITSSAPFKIEKSQKGFKKTDSFQQLKQYKKLAHNSSIKFALKTLKSKAYTNYNEIKNSARLAEYFALDQYINTDEFINTKAFLEDKHRFEKSEEHKMLHEYNEIKKSTDYQWYITTSQKKPFEEIEKWNLTFFDDFDQPKLDESKWMQGYYWGKALMNDFYALENEQQAFLSKNIELRDSKLKIVTKQENTASKIWDKTLGFRPHNFSYSSGIINTGHSYRQQFGKIEVKVKLGHQNDVNQSFWLVGETIVPQITILNSNFKNNKKFECGTHLSTDTGSSQITLKKCKGPNLVSDFHIISIEWTSEKITWKINGVTVNEQTKNIPKGAMYLNLSSHILQDLKNPNLPATMEVDWIKCYELKN